MFQSYFISLKHCLLGLSALVLLSQAFACAAPLNLTIVLSEAGGAYREYGNALNAQLAKHKNINVSIVHADQAIPESGLVIAAGMKASQAAVQAGAAALLSVLVPREGVDKLLDDHQAYFKSAGVYAYSAIYLDQPLKRQLDLISAALPDTRSIAVLYAIPPKELNTLRSLAAARKIQLNARATSAASGLFTALQESLANSDVLLAMPDPDVYNTATIRNILLASYRSKVPLIGFSPAYVKAGALCAVYTTPEQYALQSLGIIQEYADKRVLPAPQYAKEFEVSVNEHVARSLGLNIKSASQLHTEVERKP